MTLPSRNNFLQRQSAPQPSDKCVATDLELRTYVLLADGLSIKKVANIRPLISGLLRLRGPVAVFGGVIGVVVSSLQRCAARWLSHVSVEIGKLAPRITHTDAPTSIVSKSHMVWVVASLKHCLPSCVRARELLGGVSVLGGPFRLQLPIQASTRTGSLAGQRTRQHQSPGATITLAQPLAAAFVTNSHPSSEPFTSQFNQLHSDSSLLTHNKHTRFVMGSK